VRGRRGGQLEAVRKGGRGAGEKIPFIGQSEMLRVGAFLAGLQVHISQRKFIIPFQTFIFPEKGWTVC
jgi:hypothetical protein